MTPRTKSAAGLIALALVVLAGVGWAAGLGGSTTYLAIRGASMRPAVAAGDFAVVRRGGPYRVGEVAAYRSATLHHVVLHRIAAIEGSTYTFKGDANSFTDPEAVPGGAIVGRLSMRVPRLGSALLWLAHPFNALLLLLALTLLWWDRWRLRALLLGSQDAPVAAADEGGVEEQPPNGWAVGLGPERVVTISDLSFPQELAIADVVDPTELTRIAERYDRPILHDAISEVLFVVEGGLLFRCALAAQEPSTLSIVRAVPPRQAELYEDEQYDDAAAYEQLAASDEASLDEELAANDEAQEYAEDNELVPYVDGLEQAEEPVTLQYSRPRRWYDRSPADRRRTPQGRDWGYTGMPTHAPVHEMGA